MACVINIGAGTGSSTQAQQFFDRLLVPPTGKRESLYCGLIDDLVASGVWALLDVLFVFAAADSATALTNLVQTSYFGAANDTGGFPTFTVDRGFTGVGINTNVVSQFNPSTATSPNFVQNSGMVAAWSLTTTQSNNRLIGQTGFPDAIELWPLDGGNTLFKVNGGTEGSAANGGDSSGFFLTQRTASGASAAYRNDSLLGTSAGTSAAPTSVNILFAAGPYQCAAGAIGASLSAAQRANLYNRLSSYLSAVGAI